MMLQSKISKKLGTQYTNSFMSTRCPYYPNLSIFITNTQKDNKIF